MSVELLIILCTLVAFLGGCVAGALFGRWWGQHTLLRQLFEAKDQELWVAGHYLSVDLREKTKPHRRGES